MGEGSYEARKRPLESDLPEQIEVRVRRERRRALTPAACISIRASAAEALLRSRASSPSRRLLSNNRLICRPAIAVGNSRSFIAFPPNESFIARRVSGRAGPYQHLLQCQQRRQINARRAHHHRRTRDRIEHPAGNADDDACRSLHLHKLAGRSLLHPPNKNLASKIRVPWIVDFQLLPDMGRMNG